MIPQRLLSGVCEITTGQLSITQRPPVYTGEASALTVQISFKFQGVDYDIPDSVVAEMYLRYPNTEVMTIATEMAVEDNVATGVLTAEQTGVAGYPLLVIQLTDSDTASVIVACATTVKVSDVRGNLVVDTRPPSPSEIIYVGRSPYIDPVTKNWMVWNVEQGQYVNSGILAEGTQGYTPEISIGVIQSVPTGESAAVRLRGTARYPIMDMDLPRSGDGIGEHEIYQTIAVADWGGTGPYTYDIADATINANMVIVEKWFDDGTVVPADLYATIPSAGHVSLSIAVKPEHSIGLHLSLCTNGTDILEDLSDAIEAVNQAVEDVEDAVEVVEGIGPYDGLDSTSTALALSANQGKQLSDQIEELGVDLLYSGDPINSINLDLEKYKILYFVTNYNQVLTIIHNGAPNSAYACSTSRFYQSALPIVFVQYTFKINSDGSSIYIDPDESIQMNITSEGVMAFYSINSGAYFKKVYGRTIS